PRVASGTGDDAVLTGPDDARAGVLQRADQVHVLMGAQRREATDPLVGRRTYAQVGAVDVPVAVLVTVPLLVGGLDLAVVALPVVHPHGAAHHFRLVPQLLHQPVRRHSAVGVGAGQPARAPGDDVGGAGAARLADVARVD